MVTFLYSICGYVFSLSYTHKHTQAHFDDAQTWTCWSHSEDDNKCFILDIIWSYTDLKNRALYKARSCFFKKTPHFQCLVVDVSDREAGWTYTCKSRHLPCLDHIDIECVKMWRRQFIKYCIYFKNDAHKICL